MNQKLNDNLFALADDAMMTWEEVSKENEPWFKQKAIFFLPKPHPVLENGMVLNGIAFLKIEDKVIPQYVHIEKDGKMSTLLDKNISEYFKNQLEMKS